MAGWDEILAKMDATGNSCDSVRRGYLKKLHNVTHRNIIAYYSAFLQKPTASNISISDSDMTGFMNAIKGLDCNKGLDFILHTPGGDPTAAESIVNYLRGKFKNDIRVIVPHLALSAGTMVACSAKEIVMGNHSNLGPIDPQISGIPAYDIVFLFLQAKAEIESNPSSVAYWKLLLEKYPST